MDLHLKGKIAVVTGGAAGIGGGISSSLAREGCNIVVADFRPIEETEAFCRDLESKYGVRACGVQGDVSDPACVKAVFAKALEQFGTVDILVSNAGRMGRNDILDVTLESLQSFERVNIEGMFLMCQEFVRIYREQKKTVGHIVVTVSKAYITNPHCKPEYILTKGAQASFVRGLATEVGHEGIYVNGIVPGYVMSESASKVPVGYWEESVKRTYVNKIASVEEMGDITAFLCSDRSCQTMGALVDVTGGCLLQTAVGHRGYLFT